MVGNMDNEKASVICGSGINDNISFTAVSMRLLVRHFCKVAAQTVPNRRLLQTVYKKRPYYKKHAGLDFRTQKCYLTLKIQAKHFTSVFL